MWRAALVQYIRVDDQDVCHGDECHQARSELCLHGCTAFSQMKVAVQVLHVRWLRRLDVLVRVVVVRVFVGRR